MAQSQTQVAVSSAATTVLEARRPHGRAERLFSAALLKLPVAFVADPGPHWSLALVVDPNGDAVPIEAVRSLRRIAMTWRDYRLLGDEVRGEYIHGSLVAAPPPSRTHQEICFQLTTVLSAAVGPDLHVCSGWGWRPASGEPTEFVPDVMVHPDTDDDLWFAGTPALLVDVLTPADVEDLVVRSTHFARHGVRDYWVVDTRERQLTTFQLVEGTYQATGSYSAGTRAVRFDTRRVPLDVGALWA